MSARLSNFSLLELQAFALAGLMLMNAVNDGALVASEQRGPEKATRAIALVGRLYALQDAVYSCLPDDLAEVVAWLEAEGGAQ